MLKGLRARFVLSAMTAFLLVLTVLIAGINLANYFNTVREADSVLRLMQDNRLAFPRGFGRPEQALPPGVSPELPYESRYFTVSLDAESGQILKLNTSQVAAIGTETATRHALDAWQRGAERGFTGNYRYAISQDGDRLEILFLDWGRRLDSCRAFLTMSLLISLLGSAAVFGLLVFFSGRVVRPIVESQEKQKRFITDAGHELKTPLAVISADAEVLEMELGENEWLTDIRRQTSRLSELTEELICLARLDEAVGELPFIDFPVSDLVNELATSFQALAQTGGKSFNCAISPGLSLCGDERSIRRLVSVLLDNALKYSPQSGEISLSLSRQGGSIVLNVTNDTVQPIDPTELPHLFDRFYRTDPSRSSGTGGYGIGLSVAQAIVTAHKGKIHAESTDKPSLSITVSLPG